MIFIILIALLALLILGPQQWAKYILNKYSTPRNDIQGTGGQFVKHLRKKFNLDYLKLEPSDVGDHYDPMTKTIRLSESNLNGQSLTAIAVAAHEFGHALQHAKNYQPLIARTRMVGFAQKTEKIGGIALMAMPLLSMIPGGIRWLPLLILLMIITIAISSIVHLVTLPVEFDASFGRALPILKQGQYISDRDMRSVRHILLACAFTYLASSLAGLLNFWRWLRFLRR
ncbi:MAG: peptidase [SAR86 cluster bacterium]|uniref:Peptidase n=1 Tax=SAR86 cluster bacterium TaxID=2030880 RepID=A0A2A5CJY0_9GAMM|nr:zinc metallopeptidase [Gammaproteobacteria bacterium AH-315-E17]PCJ41795.1 MAG: peptidase [SAR86 cluster bacterium]PCJ43828.1 MAG: peptidase [SAR86 cluster bacterium]